MRQQFNILSINIEEINGLWGHLLVKHSQEVLNGFNLMLKYQFFSTTIIIITLLFIFSDLIFLTFSFMFFLININTK